MKNKWIYIALAVIILLLTAFFILQANSMLLAMSSRGLETDGMTYIEEPFTDDEGEYAVIQTYTKDDALALVRLKKNWIGFWTVETVKSNDGFAELAWLKVADPSGRTDYKLQTDGRYEWHFVCCGNDANGNIEITNELLPENVTVSVRQTGQQYTIHLISFSNEGFGSFSLRQVLVENGFVSE